MSLLGEDPDPVEYKRGASDLHEGEGQVQGQRERHCMEVSLQGATGRLKAHTLSLFLVCCLSVALKLIYVSNFQDVPIGPCLVSEAYNLCEGELTYLSKKKLQPQVLNV